MNPGREIKQGDETVIGRGAGSENEGTCLYNEYLNWDLHDKKESALQSSMWRICSCFPGKYHKMRISREIQEQKDQCDGITVDGGGGERWAAVISHTALQVMASGLDFSLGAVGNHGKALSREAKWSDTVFLKGYSSCLRKIVLWSWKRRSVIQIRDTALITQCLNGRARGKNTRFLSTTNGFSSVKKNVKIKE